jgi:hypothetical protein
MKVVIAVAIAIVVPQVQEVKAAIVAEVQRNK